MSVNPYESPSSSNDQTSRPMRGVISYLATSIVSGALVGAALMFCYSFFVVAPLWAPRMYKGDERWETIFYIASTLLPISVTAGIVLALVTFVFVSFRMRHRHILIACFALWFLISANRPVVSRVRRPGIPDPKFETVPDTMIAIVCLVFVVTLVSGLVQLLANRNGNSTQNDGITNG